MRNFQLPGRSPALAVNGMAATSSTLATLTALDVLKAGGNAIDAAVSASAVLCMTEPHMTGIGGDCFALVGKPDGTVVGLNGSGRASLNADSDWLSRSGLTTIADNSVHAVTVPGAVDAWDQLLKNHGTTDLKEVLVPAIRLAEQGVPVSPRVAWDWTEMVPSLAADEGGQRHYLKDGGAPRTGDTMRYPVLAKTLRLIAEKGRDEFYCGSIAADIVDHLKSRGSLLSREDFARTEASWVEPIATTFANCEILEIPPNGQGITALIALNILARLDPGRYGPDSVERRHCEIEAMRLAWVLRNRHVADPEFVDITVEELLSARTADRLAGLIDMRYAIDDPAGRVPPPGSDTIYLTVVDRNRLAVSFINSIYDSFGSGIITPNTGIVLQNRGSCFVATPGHPNCIGPGKRPLHTIIPAMVRHDGRVDMPFGVMGGAFQPMGHMTVMLNRYVYGMDPQAATDFPRVFPEDGGVLVEEGVPASVVAGLRAKGHCPVGSPRPLGGGQAIAIDRDRGVLIGGSDFRKDGIALGY
jgi:gamma-glutamyltranspeptidase/glutathione hydrolase